jgi:hypothetical protein
VIQNFMAYDLSASVAAVCLFPLFVFIPGYVAGWVLNLLDFRQRSFAFRTALSIPLSIGLAPVVSYLAGRFAGTAWVWGIFAFTWVCFAWSLVSDRPTQRGPSKKWVFPIYACAAWGVIAILSLIDLQSGHKLYYSTIALDFSVRTEFIQAITSGGIPPHNPFFISGAPDPLHYHYFWLILCSLVDSAGGALVTARHAWIGGAVWCGVGLIAIVILFFRIVLYAGAEEFRRRATIAILLLGVTGLDLLPVLFLKSVGGGFLPSVEWWNEQVDSFLWTALWEAHYTAGLIAVLVGFLLLWEAPQRVGAARWKHAIAGGVALATSLGAGIFVGLVFGAFLAVWMIISVVKKWRAETAVLAVAGIVCVALAAPFLLTMVAPAQGSGGSGVPFGFMVRRFLLVDRILNAQGLGQLWRVTAFNLALLPLNYLLELGFFLGASYLWWRKRRQSAEPLSRAELAVVVMTAASMVVCTFIASTAVPNNNDLGWRGFLIAQFGMLILSASLLADKNHVRHPLLSFMLIVGIAGALYDVAMQRLYPVLADAGAFPHLVWMSGDRNLGERNYDVREAYEWMRRTSPANATVQFDPHPVWQDTPAFLYADRQIVAGYEDCLAGFGGNSALCAPLVAKVETAFPARETQRGYTNRLSIAPSLDAACRNVPARMLLVKDIDAIWQIRDSWVWRDQPAFSNARVRVFDCSLAKPAALPVLSGATRPISRPAPK